MKIGAFSRKHHVSIDTVRYYIKLGLLLPLREGLRHNFDELCHENMEMIHHYKSLNFSLLEIQRLMSVQSLYNGAHRIKRESVLEVLKEKSLEVEQRIKKEKEALSRLKDQISAMESNQVPIKPYVLPLSVLELLACPECGSRFAQGSESLKGNGFSDTLICRCGFQIKVEGNILTVQELTSRFKQDNPNKFIREFLKNGEGSEIVKALDQMIYRESQRFRKRSGNILCFQNLPVIPFYKPREDGYYILVSDNRPYLDMIYESLCLFGGLEHFILIHSSLELLPLKQGTISSIYDCFYSDQASLMNKSRYLDELVSLLTEEGDYLHIGLFTDKQEKSNGLARFNLKNVTHEFLSHGLTLVESHTTSTAPLKKLLSQSIMEQVEELGYSLDDRDRGSVRTQLFTKK